MTMQRRFLLVVLAAAAASATAASPGRIERPAPWRPETAGASALEVDRIAASAGATVRVAVRVRDATGTPLGAERQAGARVQGLAFRVQFLPADAVTYAVVRRTGAAAPLTALFEAAARPASGIAYLAAFDERNAALPLAPGGGARAVAELELTLAADLAPGTRVELRLDPAATALSNQAGTVSETPGNGWLRLRDGAIRIVR
jgi:hypothetical protein